MEPGYAGTEFLSGAPGFPVRFSVAVAFGLTSPQAVARIAWRQILPARLELNDVRNATRIEFPVALG
jgi:hypothetical protein